MTLPRVRQNIQDGALGLSEQEPTSVQAKVGACSLGTPNTLYSFSDATLMRTTLGQGPLVEAVADTLAKAGGPVLCMPVNTSVAGAAGAVTKTGTGTGTVTVAGAAYDAYEFIGELTRDGTNIAAGTAAFRYSLDGGDTYSDETAVPTGGVFPIPFTNLQITFVNGGSGTSFIKGDKHTFTSTAPGFSATDVTNALVALRADPSKWAWGHLVGAATTASGAATIAAAVDVQMAAAEAQYRYVFFVVEVPDVPDADLKTAFQNFVSSRVMVCAGYCELTSPVTGRTHKRSSAWPVTARLAQQDPRRDAGRWKDDREGGALEGVTKLYRDEHVTEALDEARFTTLKTFPGQPGFYITNGRMMASSTSDFKFVQFRRIMDLVCTLNYPAMLTYLNDDDAFTVDAETGFITEVSARALQAEIRGKLTPETVDKNRVTDVQVVIRRDNNILSSMTLFERLRVMPKGYAKYIEADIGFYNPALAPKVA